MMALGFRVEGDMFFSMLVGKVVEFLRYKVYRVVEDSSIHRSQDDVE